MRISNVFVVTIAAAVLLVTGCAKQRAPATKALEQIETSLAEVRDDAARYAPDGLKAVEAQVARLKTSLENKDYENVLAGSPQLAKAVASLKGAVSAGKAQVHAAVAAAKSEWASLKVEVPRMVEDIQARVDTLSKTKRLPWGIDKQEFEGAKNAFESMKSTWADASAEARAGDAREATAKAKAAKGMGQELIDRLKVKQS